MWPLPAVGWVDEFLKLSGPELYRVEVPAVAKEMPDVPDMPGSEMAEGSGTLLAWLFLREWAQTWTQEGTGLTTRVSAVDVAVNWLGGGEEMEGFFFSEVG